MLTLLLVQFKVKMVTADDDSVTDIVVEGDKEEIERLSKVGACGGQVLEAVQTVGQGSLGHSSKVGPAADISFKARPAASARILAGGALLCRIAEVLRCCKQAGCQQAAWCCTQTVTVVCQTVCTASLIAAVTLAEYTLCCSCFDC